MEKVYDKKKEIIKAAIYLFSEKGFSLTSVQDIANYCNISKATIYKLFKSKEEILINLIDYVNKQMFISLESADLEIGKDKISTLEKKFTVFFKHLYKRKDFTIMVYENNSLMKDPKLEKIILRNRSFLLNWYKTILLEAFGEKIKNILWDIVFVTAGIIKEFNYLFIIKETIAYDFGEISKFLVKSIEAVIESHYKEKALIPKDMFELFERKISIDKVMLLDQWQNKIDEMYIKIKKEKKFPKKVDVMEALNGIEDEIKKENPRKFFIESVLLYLSNFETIESEVLFLKNLYLRADIYNL